MPGSQRAAQADARRSQLIETALALFATEGIEGATIRRLAEAATIAPALVYHYFPDKDALLVAVVERHNFLPMLRALLAEMDGHLPESVLLYISRRFLSLLGAHAAIVRIFVSEAQTRPVVAAAWDGLIAEGAALLAAYLDGQVAAGNLRPHDTLVTARTFFFTHLMLHLTGTASDAFTLPFVETMLYGIAPHGRAPRLDDAFRVRWNAMIAQEADAPPDGVDTVPPHVKFVG